MSYEEDEVRKIKTNNNVISQQYDWKKLNINEKK